MLGSASQAHALEPPRPEDQVLSLKLACPVCQTFRVFLVEHSVKMVLDREVQYIMIRTFCEVCLLEHDMTLYWGSRTDHFTYHAPDLVPSYQGYTDINGMHREIRS